MRVGRAVRGRPFTRAPPRFERPGESCRISSAFPKRAPPRGHGTPVALALPHAHLPAPSGPGGARSSPGPPALPSRRAGSSVRAGRRPRAREGRARSRSTRRAGGSRWVTRAACGCARPTARAARARLRARARPRLHARRAPCSPRRPRGLFEIGLDGRVAFARSAPGGAARARRVLRVAASALFVASDDGIFVARDARPSAARRRLPDGETTRSRGRRAARAARLWVIVARRPVRGRARGAMPPALHAEGFAREPLATRAAGPSSSRPRRPGRAGRVAPQRLGLWTSSGLADVPLTLPPGVEPLRFAFGAGRLWLATDGGLSKRPGSPARGARTEAPAAAPPRAPWWPAPRASSSPRRAACSRPTRPPPRAARHAAGAARRAPQ